MLISHICVLHLFRLWFVGPFKLMACSVLMGYGCLYMHTVQCMLLIAIAADIVVAWHVDVIVVVIVAVVIARS